MVATAIINHVSVIDASETIGALHQTTVDGNKAGFKNSNFKYNYDVIGNFNYALGYTSNTQTRTVWDQLHQNVIIQSNSPSQSNTLENTTVAEAIAITTTTVATPALVVENGTTHK